MSIGTLEKSEFRRRLYQVVRPSTPIDSPEFLFGRNEQIQSLSDVLCAPGRHAFIYGHRGVGKSSLAHSVAYELQEESDPIFLSCAEESTMESIISDAMREALGNTRYKDEWTAGISIGLGGTGVKLEHKKTKEIANIEIKDVSSCVYALQCLVKIHSQTPYIVIDEFDRIENPVERERFGTLLKQLGDKRINVKLIFTGVAENFQDVLGGHLSSARQVHELKLKPLSWDGREKIIKRAFGEFDIEVPDDIIFRISGLSDGFPHYVHIICENMLYVAFEMDQDVKKVDYALFINGLTKAVKSVEQSLRTSYDKATYARDAQHAFVLWSVADSGDLQRKKNDIYESYLDVINQLKTEPLSESSFTRILSLLKKESHGEVITPAFQGKRPGWYRFNENMLRGYVRMHAEVRGINLDFQKNFTGNEPTANVRTRTRFSKSYSQIEKEVDEQRKNEKRKME